MTQFTNITSRLISLPNRNVDTDQIIPARFLKVTDKEGLGEALFADWRYHPDGSLKTDFVFNEPQHKGVQILVAGDHFGCGSSREHAPWALVSWGIRAVISTSFADIFSNNALKNSLLPIEVSEDIQQSLFDLAEEAPRTDLKIDLDAQTLTLPDGTDVHFEIDAFAKMCLLQGVDQLGYIASHESDIAAFEAARIA